MASEQPAAADSRTAKGKGMSETDFYTDPETGVIYWRDTNGILRPRELTNPEGEVVGYEQAAGFFPSRVEASS